MTLFRSTFRPTLGRSARSALFGLATVTLVIALAACGGEDDGDNGNDEPAADPTATTAATTAPDANDNDSSGSDSVTAEFLDRFFGLPPSFVTGSQRACMDAELAADFPNGIPADATFDDELVGKFDAAAEECNVAGLGS